MVLRGDSAECPLVAPGARMPQLVVNWHLAEGGRTWESGPVRDVDDTLSIVAGQRRAALADVHGAPVFGPDAVAVACAHFRSPTCVGSDGLDVTAIPCMNEAARADRGRICNPTWDAVTVPLQVLAHEAHLSGNEKPGESRTTGDGSGIDSVFCALCRPVLREWDRAMARLGPSQERPVALAVESGAAFADALAEDNHGISV